MEKLNIAEILKDCPKGMELDCTIYENVEFDYIEQSPESRYPIHCLMKTNDGYNTMVFTNNGCYDRHPNAKCVIFPKGKTTWEGFQRPFKDGDVVYIQSLYEYIVIYKETNCKNLYKHASICISFNNRLLLDNNILCCEEDVKKIRFATEEEKQKLFDAIKAKGYKWNAETKTLEKLIQLKFKVGDVIQDIDTYKVKITEVNIEDECYGYESMIAKGIGSIGFSKQDDWKLVPNKFNISTLKPFESRVLVRDFNDDNWRPAIFGAVVPKTNYNDQPFVVVGGCFYEQCIPYKSNEYLLGTTNDCDDYYKTWE